MHTLFRFIHGPACPVMIFFKGGGAPKPPKQEKIKMPKAPEPLPPPPPPVEVRPDVDQATKDARTREAKKRGIGATLLAGETGGSNSGISGKFQRVLENGILDLLWEAIGMRRLGPGDPVEKSLGSKGLEIAPDLVKLLPGIAHELAGFGNVIEFGGELKQAELATSDFLFSGHVVVWFLVVQNPYQNDMAAVCFTGLPLSGYYHLCTHIAFSVRTCQKGSMIFEKDWLALHPVHSACRTISRRRIKKPPVRPRARPRADQKNDATPPVTPWSVQPKQYEMFLSTIFNKWMRHDVGEYYVQMFDVTLGNWLNCLCTGCQHFFNHTRKSMQIMRALTKAGRSPAEIMRLKI